MNKFLIIQGFTHNFHNFFAIYYGFTLNFRIFAKNELIMALRIKELCKEKHITMAEIADQIGIKPITLSQSLNGNPTLSRLQEVADVLSVDVVELFEQPKKETICGCICVNGKAVPYNSREEIEALLKKTYE